MKFDERMPLRYVQYIFSEMEHGTDQMKVQGKLSRRREDRNISQET